MSEQILNEFINVSKFTHSLNINKSKIKSKDLNTELCGSTYYTGTVELTEKSFRFIFTYDIRKHGNNNDALIHKRVLKSLKKFKSEGELKTIVILKYRGDSSLYYFTKVVKTSDDDFVIVKNESIKRLKIRRKETTGFGHLHLHTQYSQLDGLFHPKVWVKRAKEMGFKSIGITDHGNLAGAYELYEAAIESGIKPTIGMEGYICDLPMEVKDKTNRNLNHITLIAKNRNGFKNLIKINNIAWLKGFYYRPRIDLQTLINNKEDIIVLSGCAKGMLGRLIVNDKVKEARRLVKKLKKEFGGDFYIELMGLDWDQQWILNNHLNSFALKYEIPTVITNDCHYIDPHHWELQSKLVQIEARGFIYEQPDIWFKTSDEVKQTFIENASKHGFNSDAGLVSTVSLINSEHIIDTVDSTDLVSKEDAFPRFDFKSHKLGKKCKSSEEMMERLSKLRYKKLKKTLDPKLHKEYDERYKSEMRVLLGGGYSDYFLLVYDLIRHANTIGCYTGVGRGSVGGSLVAYLLDITRLDPVKHNLLFERFLNPTRLSKERAAQGDAMADIDLDFESGYRDRIKDYIYTKYGRGNVCTIGTWGAMGLKGLIQDIIRVESHLFEKRAKEIVEIPKKERTKQQNKELKSCREIFGKTAHWEVARLTKALPLDIKTVEEAFEKSPSLSGIFDLIQEYYEKFKGFEGSYFERFITPLLGQARQPGRHAAGMVISRNPLETSIPLRLHKPGKDADVVTQWYDDYIDKKGLLKLDVLGVDVLDIVHMTCEQIETRHGKKIDIYNLDTENGEVYQLFRNGKTGGVFQYNTPGVTHFLNQLQPDRFEDLIATTSLMRPGPMASNAHIEYIELKHGRERPEYDHECVEPILKNTFGLIVFQEQCMQMLHVLGGLTLSESDQFRTLIKKKVGLKDKKLNSFRNTFMKTCIKKHGLKDKHAEEVWDKLAAFSLYSFNRSHATCYAYTGFLTQWLKCYYPTEFYASCLNFAGREDKFVRQYYEVIDEGIKIYNPDIDHSGPNFKIYENGIMMALSKIKGIGDKAAEAIEQHQPFETIDDLLERVPRRNANIKVLTTLILMGAFNRKKYGGRKRLLKKLFATNKAKNKREVPDDLRYMNKDKVAQFRREKLGLSTVSYRKKYAKAVDGKPDNIQKYLDCDDADDEFILIGCVERAQFATTKKGDEYLRFSISDEGKYVKVMAWNNILNECRGFDDYDGFLEQGTFKDGFILAIKGKKQISDKYGDSLIPTHGIVLLN